MSHDVFISHSSKDKNIADAICGSLEKKEIRCWIAPRDIRAGDSWGSAIVKGIEGSRVMVIVFSENANSSKQVMREVERAVQKDVVVVPFRIDSVQPSADMEYFLSATHWLDAMTPELDAHLETLGTTIRSILKKPEPERTVVAPATPSTVETKPAAATPLAHNTESKGNKGRALVLGMIALLVILLLGFWVFKSSESGESVAEEEPTLGDGNILISLVEQAEAANTVDVRITGASGEKDYIAIGKSDSQDSRNLQKANVEGAEVVGIVVPDAEGLYEVRYFDAEARTVVARQSLKVVTPEILLESVDEALAGTSVDVTWKAPNYKGDYLTVAEKDSPGNKYVSYSYTADGSPTNIRVPTVEGDYEIRYISGQKKTIWARRDFRATAPEATVSPPVSGIAGDTISIKWTGPAVKSDYLSIATPESDGKKYLSYKYVRKGTDTEMRLPDDPGNYEIRYISGGSNIIRDSAPIEVAGGQVEIAEIGEVEAEAEFIVKVNGPGYRSDLVAIYTTEDPEGKYLSYKYASQGTSLKFVAPKEPGNYVIRYTSGQKKREWGRREFTVKVAEVSEQAVAE